jgi:hypothetical protein
LKVKEFVSESPGRRRADVDMSQLCPAFRDRMKNGAVVNGVAVEKG